MEQLFQLEPEVAGGWGPGTHYANLDEIRAGRATVPELRNFEYLFDGWLGDELLTTHPCFIITEGLAASLQRADVSGVRLEPVKVSKSDDFFQLHPDDLALPSFVRLVPEGKVVLAGLKVLTWSGEDICLSQNAELVGTQRFLDVLRAHSVRNCEVIPLDVSP